MSLPYGTDNKHLESSAFRIKIDSHLHIFRIEIEIVRYILYKSQQYITGAKQLIIIIIIITKKNNIIKI